MPQGDNGKQMLKGDGRELLRIIQETVPGRQITLAHIIAKPKLVVYQKLGLNPNVDYTNAAIGMLTMSPGELAVIGCDIVTKASSVELGFVDRFSGTLIVTGSVSNVTMAVQAVLDYSEKTLGFSVCPITKT